MSSLQEVMGLLPESALHCIAGAVASSDCGIDVACICSNVELNAQAIGCILANSTVREGLTAQNLTNTLCGVESIPNHSYDRVLIPFVTLACLAVLLRLVARYLQGAKFWWDDACNITALIGCVAFTAISLELRNLGVGYDIWAVPRENISVILMNYYVSFIVYATSRAFIRLSIILFFIRIFSLTYARAVMLFTFALINCVSLSFIFTLIFPCTPVSYFWHRWDEEHEGSCIQLDVFMRVSALIAIVVDFWQLLVAVPFILRLNLSLKKKLLIVIMFFTGIAVIILSNIRYPTIDPFIRSRNATREIITLGTWSALELDIGVICACLPSVQVLFKYCGGRQSLSQASSGFVELDSPGGKTAFSGGKNSAGSRGAAVPHIRRTTAITQQTLTGSEAHLSLDPRPSQGCDIELGSRRKGDGTSQV